MYTRAKRKADPWLDLIDPALREEDREEDLLIVDANASGRAHARGNNSSNKRSKVMSISAMLVGGEAEEPEETEELNSEEQPKPVYERFGSWRKGSVLDVDRLFMKVLSGPYRNKHKFVCICNPFKTLKPPFDDKEDEENDKADEDEDGTSAPKCDGGKECPCYKFSSEFPSHPYTFSKVGLCIGRSANVAPKNHEPRIYGENSDFHFAKKMEEAISSMAWCFDLAWESSDWLQACAVVEAIALYLLFGEGRFIFTYMYTKDTFQRYCDIQLRRVLKMVLVAIAGLAASGQLTSDKRIKNVGWIIAMYTVLASWLRMKGLLAQPTLQKPPNDRIFIQNVDLYLRKYALVYGIAVPGTTAEELAKDPDVRLPDGPPTAEPWGLRSDLGHW